MITGYIPTYKACITVTWSDGRVEGWFDKTGTDGTPNKANHITIHA
jgi:hypothetical protein